MNPPSSRVELPSSVKLLGLPTQALAVAAAGGALWCTSLLPPVTWDGRALSWLSLLPPVTALALVVATRRVVPSLAAGALVGGFVQFGAPGAVTGTLRDHVWTKLSDPWHVNICLFALTVLGMVKVTEESGGARSLASWLGRKIRDARSAKLGISLLGSALFFDDYANAFLVGPSMRPLADRHGVSREKLAYLVDSTAAPVAGLALISTWLSYEVGLLQSLCASLDLDLGGYELLLLALPLRFYCIFALGMVYLSSAMERDLGPMVEAESRAWHEASALSIQPSTHPVELDRRYLASVLPICTLIGGVVVGFLVDGIYFGGAKPSLALAQLQAILAASEHGDRVLLSAACAASLVAAWSARAWASMPTREIVRTFLVGATRALGPLGILLCAWALGSACEAIDTGPYLVASLQGHIPPTLVPLVTFLSASAIALATGTSWGTMAILLPAALPLAHSSGEELVLLATAAAVLDGAIFGDHCSPMSDTTLLAATACDCDVMAHVKTQLPYATLCMLVSAVAYAGVQWLPLSTWLYYPFGLGLLALVLRVAGRHVRSFKVKVPAPTASD